jgi:hypothetical protein
MSPWIKKSLLEYRMENRKQPKKKRLVLLILQNYYALKQLRILKLVLNIKIIKKFFSFQAIILIQKI